MIIDDILAARERIKPYLSMTPLLNSHLLEIETGKQVWLKLETQNPTGSFKPRPAFNSMLTHLAQAKERGVIASSSGNFAQGVAYAAAKLGVDAIIVMTESTSPYKIKRTKSFGAQVVLSGDTHEARLALTEQLQKETNRVLLHPYDAFETIAGDATVGLELIEQLGDDINKDTAVLVPVSGGGLIAGIGFAIKTRYPHCKVIGIQPKVSGTLAKSLQSGHIVNVGKFKTVADALVASTLGDKPFELIKQYVDDVVLIEESKIRAATHYVLEQHKLVMEPAAALPLAALFANTISAERVICVATGGNLDLKLFLNSSEST